CQWLIEERHRIVAEIEQARVDAITLLQVLQDPSRRLFRETALAGAADDDGNDVHGTHACTATPSGEATGCALFGSDASALQVRDGGRSAQDVAATRSRMSGVAMFPRESPEKTW